MRSWIAGFSDDDIENHPPLAIAAAWVAALSGHEDRSARFAEAAQLGKWHRPMPDGTASLESALSIMSAAFGLGGISAMSKSAARAVELESAPSGWRALSLLLLGVATTLQGSFADARAALDEAVDLSHDETSTGSTSLAYLTLIDLKEGDMAGALDHAERALAVVEKPGLRNYMPSICAYTVAAHVFGKIGDQERAEPALQQALAQLPRLTEAYWWQMIVTRMLLPPLLHSLGRSGEAQTLLEEAAVLLDGQPDAGKLPQWVQDVVAELAGAPHRPSQSKTLTDSEKRILRFLASDLTLREIGRELYLSVNTVKTHTRAIYRKLGVSSRREAVAAAKADRLANHVESPG